MCRVTAFACDAGALPGRVLRHRLRTGGVSAPGWAVYLPNGLEDFKLLTKRGLRKPSCCDQSSGSGSPTEAPTGAHVIGQVWKLSQDPCGCRDVQQAFELAENDGEREAIAEELRGHIWEAVHDPHANHVIQKCIATMRPAACQFIIDELVGAPCEDSNGVVIAAQHRYACRIVQRLMEHCAQEQLSQLMDSLLQHASAIAQHPYGNYVMQNFLRHGSEDQCKCLQAFLAEEVRSLGQHQHGCAVLAGALLHTRDLAREVFCKRLAAPLLQDRELLLTIACARHGHVFILRLLALLEHAELQEMRAILLEHRKVLSESRFGRVVAEDLDIAASSASSNAGSLDQN